MLRPGGRIGISDIVAEDALSPEQRAERGSYAGCIAGALSISEFRDGLEAVGLTDISITPSHIVVDGMISAIIKASKPADARPLIDLAAPRELPGRRGRLLWRRPAAADAIRRGRRLGLAVSRSSFAPRDIVALTLAAICWGLGTVVSKAALDEIPPLTLLPIQLAASLAILGVLMRRQGISFRSRRVTAARPARPPQPGAGLRLEPHRAGHDHRQPVGAAVGPRAADDPGPGGLVPSGADHAGVRGPVVRRGRRDGVIVYDPSAGTRPVGRRRADAGRRRLLRRLYGHHPPWIPDAKETSQVVLAQQAHALGPCAWSSWSSSASPVGRSPRVADAARARQRGRVGRALLRRRLLVLPRRPSPRPGVVRRRVVLPHPDRRGRPPARCCSASGSIRGSGSVRSSSWPRSWPSSGCRRPWPHDPHPTPRRRVEPTDLVAARVDEGPGGRSACRGRRGRATRR